MKAFLDILLNTLGILALVVFGAFIIVLLIDLILTALDKNRDGILIKHTHEEPLQLNYTENNEDEHIFIDNEEVSDYAPIDMQKALEEQRLLEEKLNTSVVVQEPVQEPIFTNLEKLVEEEEEDNSEEELGVILEDLSKQLAEEKVEEVKVEEVKVEEPKVVEVQPKTIVKEKVVYMDDEANIKELRKLRKEVLVNKNEALQKQNEDEMLEKELDEKMRELEELKDFKRKVQSEKNQNIRNRVKNLNDNNEILKENENQRKKNKMLEEEKARLAEEKELLAKELQNIKQTPVEEDKPYFTREYYVSKLEQLEKELADANKELRANKREYVPIVKCKKALERDGEKLRKKEVLVAKQKVALYGVNSPKNVDPEKKQKLDEDMAVLKELKDSVLHCEQVIEQNADRFPILEKANKMLTKQVNRLTKEIETVKEAIKWYDEN